MSFLYFSPEKFGLTPVADFDLYDEPYEFTMVAVWRDEGGKFWGATDSGCSCPVPFEDHIWPTDFTEIRSTGDVEALIKEAGWSHRESESSTEFLRKISEALG